MTTGSLSGKLHPRHLDTLEPASHHRATRLWLPGGLGLLALGAGLSLLLELRQLELLLALAVCAGSALILMLSLRLQHARQRRQILTLEARLAASEAACSDLQQQSEGLQQQNQAQNRVLCVLAHDLRAPFASLKNILWLCEGGQLSPSETAALLPRLHRQVDGLYRSLDNLLVWSKHQASGEAGEAAPIPVAAIAREMTELYRPAAQQKHIDLVCDSHDRSLALADAESLRLILRNLLDNAIKFTPECGCIALSTQAAGDTVRVSVVDSGLGMSREQLAELFTTAQVRRGTAGEKGFGLGLQLCQSFAEQAGGSLSVSSQPGQGTRFELHLPRAASAER